MMPEISASSSARPLATPDYRNPAGADDDGPNHQLPDPLAARPLQAAMPQRDIADPVKPLRI